MPAMGCLGGPGADPPGWMKMKINYVTLADCARYSGVIVVIDVVRAFTTAAFGLAAGARQILLAGSLEEAFALRERIPGSRLMGEVRGMPAEGFDLWNSPAQFASLDVSGKTIIQRTSAGTQGIVLSTGADNLFAASFVVAGATARAITRLQPREVTFVITGQVPGSDIHDGSEDRACAEYIAALITGLEPEPRRYLAWVDRLLTGRLIEFPEAVHQVFTGDVELCAQIDRFDFALAVTRQNDLLVMEKK